MGYPFRSRLEHDPEGSTAVVQMKDVDETNQVRFEETLRVDLDDVREQHLLRPGDLVFKSRGVTNSAAIVNTYVGPAVLAAPMLLIRPNKAVIPAYLYWYINLPAIQTALAAQAEGTSVRMISKAKLEDLDIPIPSIQKQKVITEVAQLAEREQWLLARITQERRRLVDGILMRHATSQQIPSNKTTR
jgi:hypothetical protein